ncbi:MAG TPA: helix-turn-helix transcriptional regulator [Catalimonadaceae bacterium]|nr:helix-turn-helix transcriptional regulator [Catalimonadaceae bacterium]
MNELKKVRKAFGLTQEALAFLIGISTGLLKMIELGKRNMPSSAVVIFQWLQAEAQRLESFPVPDVKTDGIDLTLELLILQKKLRLVNEDLQKLDNATLQNLRLLEMGPRYKEKFPLPENDPAQLMLGAVLTHAAVSLKEEDQKAKILLLMERAGVEAKLQVLNQMVSVKG